MTSVLQGHPPCPPPHDSWQGNIAPEEDPKTSRAERGAQTCLRALHCIILLTCLTCTYTSSVPAFIYTLMHTHACHTCILTFPMHAYHHAYEVVPIYMRAHTYIYACGFSKAQLYLHDQLHACAYRTCIDHILISSHDSLFGRRAARLHTQLSFSLRCLRFLIERRYDLRAQSIHLVGSFIHTGLQQNAVMNAHEGKYGRGCVADRAALC